jgi:hypothetical protein
MASNVKRRKRTKAKKRYIKKNKELLSVIATGINIGTG